MNEKSPEEIAAEAKKDQAELSAAIKAAEGDGKKPKMKLWKKVLWGVGIAMVIGIGVTAGVLLKKGESDD